MEAFLERFPEGEYEFEGKTLEGDELEGETEFTHDIPNPPEGLFPGDGATVDVNQRLVVRFDPVTVDLDGDPIVIEEYEVILEADTELGQTFTMILDGSILRPKVTIPHEFMLPGTTYKFEVGAQEVSGNRTLTEVEFSTL